MTQEVPFDALGTAPAKPGWGAYLSGFAKTPGRAKAALVGCLVLMVVSPSGVSAMTPFIIPAYAEESGTAVPIAVLMFTTLPLIVAPLVLPFAGRWVDRFGARRVAVPAAIAYAATTALIAVVGSITPVLGVVVMVSSVFGFAATLAVVFKVVSAWFPDHRGMGFALIGMVSSLASAVLSPVYQWLISGSAGLGWDGAFLLTALAIALIAIPAALWLVSEPTDSQPSAGTGMPDTSELPGSTLRETVRTRVWILIAAFLAFAAMGPMAVRQNSVDFYGERGFDPGTVSIALSVLFLSSIIGLLLGGTLLDRSTRPWIIVPLLAAVPAGLLISFFNHGSIPLLFVAMALLGFATGAESSLGPFLIARYFGLRAFGQIQGLTLAISTVALGMSPFLISALSTAMGSYTVPFTFLTLLTLIAVVLAALLPHYPAPRTSSHLSNTTEDTTEDTA